MKQNHELTLLNEREKTHGAFNINAYISQNMKEFWREQDGWSRLTFEQREALDMIALKVGRILSGKADYADHWADLSGYGKLAEETCQN